MTAGSGRGIALIASGTLIGQLLAAASSPFLTRVYTPTEFASLATCTSLVTLLGTIGALRFDLAVALPTTDDEARAVVAVAVRVVAAFTLAVALVLALVTLAAPASLNAMYLGPWVWCLPVASAAMAVYLIFNQWAIRVKDYGAIARRNLAQAVVMVVVQVGLGMAGVGRGGLILGFAAAQIASAGLLIRSSGLLAAVRRTDFGLVEVAKKYRKFPLYLAPAGLLNVAGLQLPVIILSIGYSSQVIGWFGLTQRILALPVALLGTAIAQVYLSVIAESRRGAGASTPLPIFLNATKKLAAAGAIVAVVLLAFGPWLFSLVFGEAWTNSGIYARALGIGIAAQFVAAPLSQTLIVYGREGLQLAWDVFRFLLVCGSVAAAVASRQDAGITLWCLSLATFVSYVVAWFLAYSTLRAEVR